MAIFDTYRHGNAAPAFGGRFAQTLAHILATAAGWRAEHATRKALSGLSDHELEDIGLSRGDIDGVAQRTIR